MAAASRPAACLASRWVPNLRIVPPWHRSRRFRLRYLSCSCSFRHSSEQWHLRTVPPASSALSQQKIVPHHSHGTAPSDVKTTSLQAFASQLRAWRQQRGWSQVELGHEMGYSASLISGVESMDKPPTADFARACDLAFTTPGSDEVTGAPGTFMTFYELVAREAYPAFFAPVVLFEREAVRIHSWELGSVPGLLQTEDYARSHMHSGRPQDSDSAVAGRGGYWRPVVWPQMPSPSAFASGWYTST